MERLLAMLNALTGRTKSGFWTCPADYILSTDQNSAWISLEELLVW